MNKRLVYIFMFIIVISFVISGCQSIRGKKVDGGLDEDRKKDVAQEANVDEFITQLRSQKEDMQERVTTYMNEERNFVIEEKLEEEGKLPTAFVGGEVIVKFKREDSVRFPEGKNKAAIEEVSFTSEDIQQINEKYSTTEIKKVFPDLEGELSKYHTITYLSKENVKFVVEEYKKLSDVVEFVEPNYIYYTTFVPNDPLYERQWHHQNIQSEDAWEVEQGDEEVVIAVIDTGVDLDHPDLEDNLVQGYDAVDIDVDFWLGYGFTLIDGEDYTERDNDPDDKHGHGTHVAGIISATTNNEIGVAGVCPNCKIMPIRNGFSIRLGNNIYGTMESDDSAAAIFYAVYNGADIISMSWGGPHDSDVIRDVLDYANNRGVVLVAAAGNSNTDAMLFPAANEHVIAVAATDSNNRKASFSNYGEWVDIAAPGVDILSLRAEGTGNRERIVEERYYTASGTSMAAPVVSGVAGLLKSHNLEWSREEIERQLIGSAQPLELNIPIGSGLVNSLRALTMEPRPNLLLSETEISEVEGDGDDAIDAGETINLFVTLRNTWGTSEGASATLTTQNQYVTITRERSRYDEIRGQDTAINIEPFEFEVHEDIPVYVIDFELHVVTEEGPEFTFTFSLTLPREIIVDSEGNGDYTTLTEALLNINNGDTIRIRSGYYPSNSGYMITKSYITLIGEDKESTIIDCDGTYIFFEYNPEPFVSIPQHYIRLSDLTFKDCDISIKDNDYVTVENNRFHITKLIDKAVGSLGGTGNNMIVRDNEIYAEVFLLFGIYSDWIWGGRGSSNVRIENNKILLPYGGTGIVMWESPEDSENTIINNFVLSNKHFSPYFGRNRVFNTGIIAISSEREFGPVTITDNTIMNADLGFFIADEGGYEGNEGRYTVYHNNIINNNRHIISDVTRLSQDEEGNYWSEYYGEDIDGDNIGDSPFIPPVARRRHFTQDNFPFMYENAWLDEEQKIKLPTDTPMLISFYILPEDKSLENVFGDSIDSFKYILSEFIPEEEREDNDEFTPSSIGFGKGYLVETNEDIILTVSGKRAPSVVSLTLMNENPLFRDQEYYNLIGYPFYLPQNIQNIFPLLAVEDGGAVLSVQDLEGHEYIPGEGFSSKDINALTMLEPGKGYIVRVNRVETITYSSRAALNVICNSDIDCPNRFLNQDYFCQDDYYSVYDNVRTYTCANPGTINSFCQRVGVEPIIIGICDSVIVDSNPVRASCYEGRCIQMPLCMEDNNCPDRPTNPFCQENDVYQMFPVKHCINARSPDATCEYEETEPRLIEECEQECRNGRCMGNSPMEYDWGINDIIQQYNRDEYMVSFRPEFADMDNDGDIDLIVSYGSNRRGFIGGIIGFRNVGNVEDPRWERYVFSNVERLEGLPTSLLLEFADIDNDDDIDLLVSGNERFMRIYENVGDAENPEFERSDIEVPEINNRDIISTYASLIDLDGDSDLDMVVSVNGVNEGPYFHNFENVGNVESPSWQENMWNMEEIIPPPPEGRTRLTITSFFDIDNDEDYDMIVGYNDGSVHTFRNIGNAESPEWEEQQFFDWDMNLLQSERRSLVTPRLVDLDGDYDADIVVGESYLIKSYRNMVEGGEFMQEQKVLPEQEEEKEIIRVDEIGKEELIQKIPEELIKEEIVIDKEKIMEDEKIKQELEMPLKLPEEPKDKPIIDINLRYEVIDNEIRLEWDNVISEDSQITAKSIITITGNAIRKSNFFSNIIKFIKDLFKPRIAGVEVKDDMYRVYRSTDPLNLKQRLIIDGSKELFNCDDVCSYSYVENEEGIYYYSVEINGKIFSVGPVKIIKKEVIPKKTTLDEPLPPIPPTYTKEISTEKPISIT